jgi:hypothetical protein
MEFCFEGNSIKMINLCSKEDYIIGNRTQMDKNWIVNELNRNKKLRERVV